MTWLQELLNNTLFQAFLAIIAIVGFVYGFIVQRINKEKKEFSFCLKSNQLIRGKKSKFQKLSVTYDGQQIDALCVSRFTVWNSGNRTLNRTDVVESKELTISVTDECRILDTEIIACSDETNGFLVKIENEHTVKVLFEYADKNEGIVIQIIHTGNNEDIQIDCKIKGGSPLKNISKETTIMKVLDKRLPQKAPIILGGIIIVMLLCMSVISVISVFNPHLLSELPTEPFLPSQEHERIAFLILFIYSVITNCIVIRTFRKHFNMGIPKTLRNYSDFDSD